MAPVNRRRPRSCDRYRRKSPSGLVERVFQKTDIEESKRIGKPYHHLFPLSANYREVFESTLPKIGSLPPELVTEVILLYNYIKGFSEDLKTLESRNLLSLSLSDATAYLGEMVSTIERAQAIARQLIPKLEAVAGRR